MTDARAQNAGSGDRLDDQRQPTASHRPHGGSGASGSDRPGHAAVKPAQPDPSPEVVDLATTHYENFPVASFLLARQIRKPVQIIYAFARIADDIADEGDASDERRRAELAQMANNVIAIDRGGFDFDTASPAPWLWRQIEWLVRERRVPIAYLLDLVSAFDQDVRIKRYSQAQGILDYARRSADPVGRMILHLNGYHRQPWLRASDQVCTALQLINFYQDIGADLTQRNRLYLPVSALAKHGISIPENAEGAAADVDWRQLSPIVNELTAEAVDMLESGRRTLARIKGRLGIELNWICLSGQQLARMLLARHDLRQSPRLRTIDRALLLAKALLR